MEEYIQEDNNSLGSNFDKDDIPPLDFSILSVDVEHYSIDKDNIYMIAKSVECISTPDVGDNDEDKKEVIYTVVKIYKEKEVEIKEVLKSK